jgi:hypothetical protein
MEGLDINDRKYLLQLLEQRKIRVESEIEQLVHINDDDELNSDSSIADHKTELLQVRGLMLKMDEERNEGNYLKAG